MNWKLTVLGGLVFFAATWILSMGTAPLIHNGVLAETYQATAGFWRPELMQVPPDMAALMPRWISLGLIGSLIFAALYGYVHGALTGTGLVRGAKYGFGVFLIIVTVMAGWSGVFNLPDKVWLWWGVESLLMYVVGGAALGWSAERWWLRPKTG